VVTVIWAMASLIALRVVDEGIWYVGSTDFSGLPSEGQIVALDFVSSVMGIATDFLMYYLLAYVVAKLFVALTGWTPEPLPK
jgi:hypothetical protein